MKNIVIGIILLTAVGLCNAQNIEELTAKNQELDSSKVLIPDAKHSKINKIVTTVLSRNHYQRTEINDSLSSFIFDDFLNSLDNSKLYFLQPDINNFEKFRYQFDDALKSGDLVPAFEIFDVYKKRFKERMEYLFKSLETEFDYSIDENFIPDRSDAAWAKSNDELNELWRKRLKNDALNLRLTGKDWEGIAETLTKRYQNFHKAILRYDNEDLFQLYINSFAEAFDPHTSYFSPITSENFQINMSLSLEGIGAQLRNENDYTTVVKIIAGGPAYKSELLHEEDRIIGVAQGEDGEMIDVIGWRLDDVVQLIRGKKGTLVRLSILRADAGADALPEEIKIVRDKVKLEEQAAKKEVINILEDDLSFKIGVITIPAFYIDFKAKNQGDRDYKSTTKDVRRLLDELKDEKVDGVIIDLRNNGGGALQEAIELTGLFIKDGPVVQVRNSNGTLEIGQDPNPDIAYDGPLAVMVNRFSASASEIFSGAIQDYGRGIIIGEQTYGKGTVQNLVPLKRFLPTSKDKLGQLKVTIAKYYRITGSSTQNLGVVPDVVLPSVVSPEEFGESSRKTALPWDQIQTTRFEKYDDISKIIPLLLKRHEERVNRNPEFQYAVEDIEDTKEARKKKLYSLNEKIRKDQREKSEAKKKAREEAREKNLEFEIVDKGEVPVKNLKIDDPFLEEGGHILADFILLAAG